MRCTYVYCTYGNGVIIKGIKGINIMGFTHVPQDVFYFTNRVSHPRKILSVLEHVLD